MPFPNVSLPSLWDIPVAVGVPALLGQSIGSGVSASASTALGGIVQNWITDSAAKQWGVFDGKGKRVLGAARVFGVEYESGYSVTDAPLEDGAFVSYNKVRAPYSARIIMVCDGSETASDGILKELLSFVSGGVGSAASTRQQFMSALEAIVADTHLYTVVTPERSYPRANIVGYRWRRSTESGTSLMTVEIALQEVRVTATARYDSTIYNASQPQGNSPVQLGAVQPLPVQTSLLGAKL